MGIGLNSPYIPEFLNRDSMIDESLPFVLKAILRRCPEVERSDVEVNFYVARRRLLRFKRAQLEHFGQCPISDTATSPPVTRWVRRGPVGLCWKQGEDVCINVRAVFAAYEPINHNTWKNLPRAITGVFGWDDYVRSQAHAVVLALPVRNASGATMAVLSVGGPAGSDGCFSSRGLRGVVGTHADVLMWALELGFGLRGVHAHARAPGSRRDAGSLEPVRSLEAALEVLHDVKDPEAPPRLLEAAKRRVGAIQEEERRGAYQ